MIKAAFLSYFEALQLFWNVYTVKFMVLNLTPWLVRTSIDVQINRATSGDDVYRRHINIFETTQPIVLKFVTQGFLGSLNSNLRSKFQKSKWPIQYGDRKSIKVFQLPQCLVLLGFWCRWIQIWGQNFKIQNGWSNIAVKNITFLLIS